MTTIQDKNPNPSPNRTIQESN